MTSEEKLKQEVMCIPTEILFKNGKWDGLKRDNLEEYYQSLLDNHIFIQRGLAEEDTNYKQIIPQCILRYDGKYYLHKQVNGTDKRLSNKYPLFLGGHVEKFPVEEGDARDMIEIALDIEIHEEANIDANILGRKFLGLIYIEDGNPVNYVHVGLAYLYDLDSDNVTIKEKDILEDLGFVSVDYLKEHIEELTYWSKLIIPYLQEV